MNFVIVSSVGIKRVDCTTSGLSDHDMSYIVQPFPSTVFAGHPCPLNNNKVIL